MGCLAESLRFQIPKLKIHHGIRGRAMGRTQGERSLCLVPIDNEIWGFLSWIFADTASAYSKVSTGTTRHLLVGIVYKILIITDTWEPPRVEWGEGRGDVNDEIQAFHVL